MIFKLKDYVFIFLQALRKYNAYKCFLLELGIFLSYSDKKCYILKYYFNFETHLLNVILMFVYFIHHICILINKTFISMRSFSFELLILIVYIYF